MRTLHTAASRPYDIVIGPGLLKEAGERSRLYDPAFSTGYREAEK